jgi:hypothetical protein
MGMEDALMDPQAQRSDAPNPPAVEAPIRTLGVSLVAIAAVVASLTVVRQLQEQPERAKDKRPEMSPAAVDLDQLRSAGL